jgi:hypothetical protein
MLGAMQALAWLDQYAWTVMPSMLAQVDSQMSAISHQPGPWQVRLMPRKPLPSGSVADSTSSWEMIAVMLPRSPTLVNHA